MPEQLNERELWLFNYGWSCRGNSPDARDFHEDAVENAPPDPNLTRISELEAEVERLNGLLDNLWCLLPVPLKTNEQAVEFWTAAGAILKDNNLDSSRTAERKEPTDASD